MIQFLFAVLLVGTLFFSATLLMAAILFSGDMSVIQSVTTTYTEMPGPVGTFIRTTWPFLPFIGIWALVHEN